MKSYNPDQGGFDFGTSALSQDVFTVFDMTRFPEVSPEDVAARLQCRGTHALLVWRKAIEIWQETLDEMIVEELRQHDTIKPLSIEKMAMVLNEPEHEISGEIEDAIKELADAVRFKEAA